MAGCRLKVPLEVRKSSSATVSRIKRKLRVALRDMLEDLAAVSGSEQSRVLCRSVTVMVTVAVGSFRGIDSRAPLFSSSDVNLTIFFLL